MTDPITTAAQFLSTQMPWIRHAADDQGNPWAAWVLAEIADCTAKMRGIVNGPAEQAYLGPCGAPTVWTSRLDGEGLIGDGPPCEGDVYGHRGTQTGRCRTCGAEVDQEQRKAWLDGEVRSRAYRASEIEDAYGISQNLIRQWATPERGLLRVHDRDFLGRARYMLGEVLDLARQQREKAAERAAKRATKATEGARA